MTISIPDQLISDVLQSVITVLAVIAAGYLLFLILRRIAKQYPFTRLGLVIALAPLMLFNLLGSNESATLLLFAMITTLLGISIDGINQLVLGHDPSRSSVTPEEQAEEPDESAPAVIACENALKKCTRLVTVFSIIIIGLLLLGIGVSIDPAPIPDEPADELVNINGKQSGDTSEAEELVSEDIEQTGATSNEFLIILAAIEATHEEIAELSDTVASLQGELAEVRSGGTSNEFHRSAPVSDVMPENGCPLPHIFDYDARFDTLSFPAELTGTICIVSEFPFESYLRMVDDTLDNADRRTAEQRFIQKIRRTPKTFCVLVEDTNLIGQYRKTRSFEILESMEAEVFREETEDLKKFIRKNGKTAP